MWIEGREITVSAILEVSSIKFLHRLKEPKLLSQIFGLRFWHGMPPGLGHLLQWPASSEWYFSRSMFTSFGLTCLSSTDTESNHQSLSRSSSVWWWMYLGWWRGGELRRDGNRNWENSKGRNHRSFTLQTQVISIKRRAAHRHTGNSQGLTTRGSVLCKGGR